MGSETPIKLPIINFSSPNLKPGTREWDSMKSQVRKALEGYGCFEALFNKVPVEILKAILVHWQSFSTSIYPFFVEKAWTNGRLYSPYHRVMMTGIETRYSAGLFLIPKAGYIIEAPEELVDEEHPLLFKPFDHVEFLGFYYTEAGQRAESALKTYCGV